MVHNRPQWMIMLKMPFKTYSLAVPSFHIKLNFSISFIIYKRVSLIASVQPSVTGQVKVTDQSTWKFNILYSHWTVKSLYHFDILVKVKQNFSFKTWCICDMKYHNNFWLSTHGHAQLMYIVQTTSPWYNCVTSI